jgi:hypothetical protein
MKKEGLLCAILVREVNAEILSPETFIVEGEQEQSCEYCR